MSHPPTLTLPYVQPLHLDLSDNFLSFGDHDLPHTSSPETSPISSAFSHTGHNQTSSVSSCSSSPSIGEVTETFNTQRSKAPGLPDVIEEPTEKAVQEPEPVKNSYELSRWSQDLPSIRSSFGLPSPPHYDIYDGPFLFNDLNVERKQEPQQSSEIGNLANRVVSRLPSLSRRSRARKSGSAPTSEPTSAAASPKIGRSRSNSRTRSLFRRPGTIDADQAELESPALIETINEDEDLEGNHSEKALHERLSQLELTTEPLQRASTPLLPICPSEPQASERTVSMLPSPPIAPQDDIISTPNSPPCAHQFSHFSSPAISHRPSLSAINTRVGDFTPRSADTPVFNFLEEDEWSRKLGHADFQITPEPYLPARFDRQSCDALLTNWERARSEFSKHLARTTTHFGQSSKTYQLSEQKWAEIDGKWRDYHQIAIAKATENGEISPCEVAKEPAPVAKIPVMHDPRNEGKFPKLGDADIIGPMEQVESPTIQRRTSRKGTLSAIVKDGLFRMRRTMSE